MNLGLAIIMSPPKSRCYTFVARCDHDAPYQYAAGSLYCEWDYFPHKEIVIGYIQFANPRVVPRWPKILSVFSVSTRSYMSAPHKVKEYSFGTPQLSIRKFPSARRDDKPPPAPVKSLVFGEDFDEFCAAHALKHLATIKATRDNRRARRAAEKATKKLALAIYNKPKAVDAAPAPSSYFFVFCFFS